MATSFLIGKGTVVKIALLPIGSRVEPIAVPNIEVAADADAGTDSISLKTALPENVLIPAGTSLKFRNPTTGDPFLSQLRQDAKAGDASLAVFALGEKIVTDSTSTYPLKLAARTAANLGRSGNRQESVNFDSDGYSDGLTTSITQTLSLPGNWLPSDDGFATAEYAFLELREVYVWLTMPKIKQAATKGRTYHGPASINSIPIDDSADGIVTGNIEVTFNGRPNYDPDQF